MQIGGDTGQRVRSDSFHRTNEETRMVTIDTVADGAGTMTAGCDAIAMGSFYFPSDSFALVVEHLDHRTAVRSFPCCRAWWKSLSALPVASHVNTGLNNRVGWQDLVKQLEMIRAWNPRRTVSRITLGFKVIIGSLETLAVTSGNFITHLDLTYSKGTKTLDFKVLAKQLPNLKGLAVSETFYDNEFVNDWLHDLANLAREVSLESLRLKVRQYSCAFNPKLGGKDRWRSTDVSGVTDSFLKDLSNQNPAQHCDDVVIADEPLNNMLFLLLGISGTPAGARGARGGSTGGGGDNSDPSRGGAREASDARNKGLAGVRMFPRLPTSSIRKLWLSAPPDGPIITAGMAALGLGMPKLEELVIDRLKVTNEGWKRFASARTELAASAADGAGSSSSTFATRGEACGFGEKATEVPILRSIVIRVNGSRFLPSTATRSLLEATVSESVTLCVDSRSQVYVTAVTTNEAGPSEDSSMPEGTGQESAGKGMACCGFCAHAGEASAVLDCEGKLVKLEGGCGRLPWTGASRNVEGKMRTCDGKQGAVGGAPKKTRVIFRGWLRSDLTAMDL